MSNTAKSRSNLLFFKTGFTFSRRQTLLGFNPSMGQILKGFTLIELMVAISIVAITATIGVMSFGTAQRNARNNKRKADIKALQTALETYYIDNRLYPSTCGGGATSCAANGAGWWGDLATYGSHTTNYVPLISPTYIRQLPHDPKTGLANTALSSGCNATQTNYIYRSNGTDYKLIINCTPEGTLSATDEFRDPSRLTYAWQVSTLGAANW